ncbi:MAG: ribbon-helix-helix domain-containing protein [Candidatus Thorarchaeota archaeon]
MPSAKSVSSTKTAGVLSKPLHLSEDETSVRIPREFVRRFEKIRGRKSYVSFSEFVRTSIREKLEKEEKTAKDA